jgi:capsular exopolysaccharide synthesis family protein
MSRVHDALRRAGETGAAPSEPLGNGGDHGPQAAVAYGNGHATGGSTLHVALLEHVIEVPFHPAPESHLLDLQRSHETPAEEFRTLRTRLNHLQTLQPLHTVIVTSPSPAEGKTFTAVNLALAESHLADNSVLLADFDLRRPIIHNLLQTERTPGLSDYLTGQCSFPEALRKIGGTNLYLLPAGTPVKNPLELLNLKQCRSLFEELPQIFNWAILDTPPLLFSADANLLATLADGTILVVKIGTTTFDNVTRAIQSLCENNVLGIVANGARASELYSKYTYYYSKTE